MKKRILAIILALGMLLAMVPAASALTSNNCFVIPYAQTLGRSAVVGQTLKLDAWVECDSTAASQGVEFCVAFYQGSYSVKPTKAPLSEKVYKLTSSTAGRFSVPWNTTGLTAGNYSASFYIRDASGKAVGATIMVDLYLSDKATPLTGVGFVDSYNKAVTSVTLYVGDTYDFMLQRQPYHATDCGTGYNLTVSDGSVVAVDDFLGYFQLQPKAPGTATVTCTLDGKAATLKVTVKAKPIEDVFSDVNPSAYYAEALEYCYYAGLINGMGDGTFGTNVALTRGMLVTLLYRMEGEPAVSGKNPFTDVKEGRYYRDPVVWAYENDIVNGRGSGIFDPDSPVTRADLVTILYRFTDYKGGNLTGGVSLAGFTDRNKVPGYAADAMSWAVGNGLVKGITETQLNPRGTATRAQFVTILYRYIHAW